MTPTAAPTSAGTGGTLVWGKPAELLEFDPTTSLNGVSWQLFYLVYETLTEMGDNLDVKPGIAESWDTPTPTEYVFHLRQGVTFSNGRPLTADDVVGSIERVRDPKVAAFWAQQLGPIKSVTKVDDRTIKIDLERPYTPFLAALAGVSASILPMKEIKDGSFDITKGMLGSGPYMVSDHKQDQEWTFVANPHYWRAGYPKIGTIKVEIITDDAARIAKLRDGSIDLALFENVDAPKLLADVANVKSVTQDTTDYYRIDVNEKGNSKLKDPKVREAINIAIDRNAIASLALGGVGTPTAATPVGFKDSCDPTKVPSASRDLAKARQLLADANATNLTFDLIASPVFPSFPLIAQVVQQNLAEIGVTANILQLPVGDWQKRVFVDNPGTFDAAVSYFAGYGDAGMVAAWWDPAFAGWNKGFLNQDQSVADLIKQSQSLAAGSAERAALFQQLCDKVDVDGGIIALVTRPVIFGYRTDKVNPKIQPVEGYVDPLRFVQEYTLVAP